jgi:hypothetical protein
MQFARLRASRRLESEPAFRHGPRQRDATGAFDLLNLCLHATNLCASVQ